MKTAAMKSIVWAVDALEAVELQKNAELVLAGVSRNSPAEIFPVYVCNRLPSAKASDLFEEACMALSEKRLKQLAEKSALSRLHPGTILTNESYQIRDSVSTLLQFAKDKHADAIVVATHSRGAVERFFLGSFAETLLLRSNIPVITVNPRASVRDKMSKVLLPSTFDYAFRPAFEKALGLCASMGAELTVFYQEPYIPLIDVSVDILSLLEGEAQMRKKEAAWYLEQAGKFNVPLEVRMEAKPGKISESILSYAGANNFDLIAMAAQAGQAGPVVGNVGRSVVRGAECPVWTFFV